MKQSVFIITASIGIALLGSLILIKPWQSGNTPLNKDKNLTSQAPAVYSSSVKAKRQQAIHGSTPVNSSDLHETVQENTMLPEHEYHYDNIEDLAHIIKSHSMDLETDQPYLNKALNKLFELVAQGSIPAIDELINLTEYFDDKIILHSILRSLAQTDFDEAQEAVLNVLSRKLDNSTEVVRITSYLRPTPNGSLDHKTVDTLASMLGSFDIPADSRQTLIDTISRKGGTYGTELINSTTLHPPRL